jgi:hypothetical protein
LAPPLLHRLAERAREESITHFTALMLTSDRPMLRLLEHLGAPVVISTDAGSVELAVDLQPDPSMTPHDKGTT